MPAAAAVCCYCSYTVAVAVAASASFHVCFVLFVFVALRPFRFGDTIAGLWDIGYGVTVVLGEMAVALLKPKPIWPG